MRTGVASFGRFAVLCEWCSKWLRSMAWPPMTPGRTSNPGQGRSEKDASRHARQDGSTAIRRAARFAHFSAYGVAMGKLKKARASNWIAPQRASPPAQSLRCFRRGASRLGLLACRPHDLIRVGLPLDIQNPETVNCIQPQSPVANSDSAIHTRSPVRSFELEIRSTANDGVSRRAARCTCTKFWAWTYTHPLPPSSNDPTFRACTAQPGEGAAG